jgi:hypothetical protein
VGRVTGVQEGGITAQEYQDRRGGLTRFSRAVRAATAGVVLYSSAMHTGALIIA